MLDGIESVGHGDAPSAEGRVMGGRTSVSPSEPEWAREIRRITPMPSNQNG